MTIESIVVHLAIMAVTLTILLALGKRYAGKSYPEEKGERVTVALMSIIWPAGLSFAIAVIIANVIFRGR